MYMCVKVFLLVIYQCNLFMEYNTAKTAAYGENQ